MAEHLKEESTCPICMAYLEEPMSLKCGYICCMNCVSSLRQELHGEAILCPFCSVASEKNDIRPNWQLGKLVSKIKELEPQLRESLRMNPRMMKFQVHMTLDVDTANNYLIISDDLRSVQCGTLSQNREERTERFNSICVLGTPRFTSGRHYWEVDLGRSREWDLGICKNSVNRHEEVVLSAECGFWTVGLRNGDLCSASTEPLTPLRVNPQLHRIGVFLDMEIGSVSFCDVRDRSHIFTFTNISVTEPLRPFFAPANPVNDGQGSLSIGLSESGLYHATM